MTPVPCTGLGACSCLRLSTDERAPTHRRHARHDRADHVDRLSERHRGPVFFRVAAWRPARRL